MVVDTVVFDGRMDAATATDRTTELNNLSGGMTYTYSVGAVSSSGESDRSAALDVSTCAPAPSGLVSVSQTTTGTVLLWNAPAMGSGASVTGYVVYRNSGVGTSVDVVACNGRLDVTTSCAGSGLTGGVEYSYQVTALSSAGESDRSVVMESSTAPAQISGVSSSVQTTSSITLTWAAPTAEGAGQEATGYIVYRNDGLGGTSMSTVGYDGRGVDVPPGVISGLVGGREYEFVVSGLSAGGEGDVSAVLHQSTSPAAPTALRSTLQTTSSIALAWSAPVTEDGASAVTGYILYRNDGSTESAPTRTAGTSIVVSGLAGGTRYKFSIAAVSDAGLSDRSEDVSVSTASAVPGAATSTQQTASSISLSWSAPSVSSGDVASGYRVYEVSLGGTDGVTKVYTERYEGSSTVAVMSSLESGRLYTYVVSAMSDAGESDVSEAMSASTAPG